MRTILISAILGVAASMASVGQVAPKNLDWPYYGNDLGGMRYVDADQINTANVAQLSPAWILHTNVFNAHTSFETQPIIVNGTMYISTPHDHVIALDAATGGIKWIYNPELPVLSKLAICCGQDNRGVAVGGGRVFIAQLDATLVALDANTGSVLWKIIIDPWERKWTETMAPLYVNGEVIVGASGGEFQKRGHVTAYDAATGARLWRFYTVPNPGEKGSETWVRVSWRAGGATVWSTPVADPQLGLLYITTGNPAPDLNGMDRAGNNLFSCSVVALDLQTGAYRWHFQEVHHDLWDYDAAQPPHLFTLEKDGQSVPAIGHPSKNGHYYILDRRDGTPLYGVDEVQVNSGPDWQHASPTQPIPHTEELVPHVVTNPPAGTQPAPFYTPPHAEPVLIQPGFEAGPEWAPGAFSPRTKYAYIPAGGYEPWEYKALPWLINTVGSTAEGFVPGIENYGQFVAMDTTTGKIAWKLNTPEKIVSGVVVAGDLVFFGESNGKFDAVDASTGKLLWSFQSHDLGVGGANGSPAAYSINGREYVVMAFGGNNQVRSRVQHSAPPGDALIAFALPQGSGQTPSIIEANPTQVDTGEIPASDLVPPSSVPPADARVIEMETHDFKFFPSEFVAQPGEKLALHIRNSDVALVSIAFKFPSGPLGLQGPILPNQAIYFVFQAPAEPGNYPFFSPLGPERFFGMTGNLQVRPSRP